MEGWNGRLRASRRSSWSFHQEIGSDVSSSSSGTIVSAHTTTASAYTVSSSRFSSFSMEATIHFDHDNNTCLRWEEAEAKVRMDYIHFDHDNNTCLWWEEAEAKERMDYIRSLVLEFSSDISVGDISVVERWLTEVGVGWLLSLDDGASVEELESGAWIWIRVLNIIAESICFTRPFFPVCGSAVGERCTPYPYHLALFIQEAMLKMLTFVDVLLACDPIMTQEFLTADQVMPPTCHKLIILLLCVHNALSSFKNQTQFSWATSAEVKSIENAMAILLSEYTSKLGEAIRSIMKKIRTKLVEDGNDSSTSLNPQGSSDIHKATRSVVTYIRFLQFHYSSVDAAICGQYVSHIENVPPVDNMIIEMVACLREKLANISKSFPDQGLRFLFLLNNSYFLLNFQSSYSLQRPWLPVDLKDQIESYMVRYLQVSWAPLLSCLSNPTPLCLGINHSLLSKFESEFQKIYNTQKEWKVPDPDLRRRLREAITEKIIPGYTEYIEDNKVAHPKISPPELEAMLQEIFEG